MYATIRIPCIQTEGVTRCRFSPNFSKRCTHLIVSSEQSDASQLKVYLASINKEKWHAHAVRFEWLMECASQHRQVAEDSFAVQPPRHEVGHRSIQHIAYVCMHNRSDSRMPHVLQDVGLIQQRLQEVATPTVSEAASGYAVSEVGTLLGASKASARQGHLLELLDLMAAALTLVTSSCRGMHWRPRSTPTSQLAQLRSRPASVISMQTLRCSSGSQTVVLSHKRHL